MEDRVGAHMDDALAFVPSGANLLEAVRGELNGDGIEYQLLVIDQPTPEGLVPGQHGPNRVLLLLRGDGRGRWQLAARNDKLVPCSTRGGLAGDPFAYAMVEKGTFSVITNGGSRERWSSTYRFRYAPACGQGLLGGWGETQGRGYRDRSDQHPGLLGGGAGQGAVRGLRPVQRRRGVASMSQAPTGGRESALMKIQELHCVDR